MSLVDIIPYFQSKLDALGYEEWQDEFNIENIPRHLLSKTYHLAIGLVDGSEASHTAFTFDMPITVTVFSDLSGSLGSSKATQKSLEKAHSIVCELCVAEDRYSQPGFIKIVPTSIDFQPISASNDNVTKVSIVFGVQTKEEFRRT